MRDRSDSLYHLQPRLDDILNDVAPFPYTLGAFIAFLSEHQCLETVEFLLETERYRRIYHWLEHKTETCEVARKAHLSGLWNRLIKQYIRPHGEREINIPCDIRQQLMQQFHKHGDDPPPPEILDRVVNNVKELLRGSILIPFLRRSSATARVQPLSMPCLNDCLPEEAMSGPFVSDDIQVNRCPREDYPSRRSDSTRRYGFYGEPASSSVEDDGEYASSAVMSSASDRSDIQDFAVKGNGETTSSRTSAVRDRPSPDDRKGRGWRKRFKEGLARHLLRSSE
ncbi:regulator of G-protein signaling domain-containing protein [Aspergillus novofumigatus IBT 16806]|uniref:Regulator of G protein signaling superfamily n=1 Tax=Aspergillus novofumigatus (strain IBT 16806) TaxID=1392255 RepID=A0A2I1CFF2_ASPN1|nr:regulator of G protein signaling superfamily [Aspergillus novofumigatus IBT 16806]PKX96355.1 regulator of G protein signaling superfamily [Aspergillus novofumigatus IBT 16806]